MKFYLILLWFLVAGGLFLAFVRYLEGRSLYFPMRQIETVPRDPYEDIYFGAADGTALNGWFIGAPQATRTVLFLHGNGGNISHRSEKLRILRRLGANVFIFDYRGYGKSSGRPSERGLYRDADAAYRYLIEERKLTPESIVLYGESLGGAVASKLAARLGHTPLVTENAFSSVKDMARRHYPYVPAFLIAQRFDTLGSIRRVKAPKLIIHSLDDEIVPFEMGRRLFEAASGPKRFLELKGAHNIAFLDSGEDYERALRDFLTGPAPRGTG